jgi:hypothetical protein
MTSRTTPVGVIVIALISLVAVGCNAQTSAVFETLLDPARANPPAVGGDAASDATSDSDGGPAWWPHPDGYAMALPSGWSGVAVTSSQQDQLVGAVAESEPALARRVRAVLGDTKSRVSAVAADTAANGALKPVLVVLAQPTEGRKARAVKARVADQIAGLPGIQGVPVRMDVHLPDASGVRFDYYLHDPDLGSLRARSYLFRFGGQAYLVSFAAASSSFDDAEAVFDAIAESLRFGV